jgi:hypothetical protein
MSVKFWDKFLPFLFMVIVFGGLILLALTGK